MGVYSNYITENSSLNEELFNVNIKSIIESTYTEFDNFSRVLESINILNENDIDSKKIISKEKIKEKFINTIDIIIKGIRALGKYIKEKILTFIENMKKKLSNYKDKIKKLLVDKGIIKTKYTFKQIDSDKVSELLKDINSSIKDNFKSDEFTSKYNLNEDKNKYYTEREITAEEFLDIEPKHASALEASIKYLANTCLTFENYINQYRRDLQMFAEKSVIPNDNKGIKSEEDRNNFNEYHDMYDRFSRIKSIYNYADSIRSLFQQIAINNATIMNSLIAATDEDYFEKEEINLEAYFCLA